MTDDVASTGYLAESELIAAARRGEQWAFAALYDLHAVRAFHTARLLLPDRMSAEEALQDAFTRAFRSLHRFQADRPFAPWLLRILVNECRRRSRKLSRDRAELMNVHDGPRSQQTVPDAATVTDLVIRDAVARLPVRYREAVVLHYFNDLPIADAARVLGCPAGTVKYRLHQARKQLADMLQEEDESDAHAT